MDYVVKVKDLYLRDFIGGNLNVNNYFIESAVLDSSGARIFSTVTDARAAADALGGEVYALVKKGAADGT